LLEVLLEVQERHVQQVHGLVQPWIDLQLLLELGALIETGLHRAAPPSPSDEKRARRRAVSVGPRYMSATVSSNTSSRTVPDTFTWPSNMMYARSTMSSVCSTLW